MATRNERVAEECFCALPRAGKALLLDRLGIELPK